MVNAIGGFQAAQPVIVKLIEPPGELNSLADVLLGSLGLAGVLTMAAVLCAAVIGGTLFWLRSRKPLDH
jgi:hypothetical protein